jgi:hypothetical protein
MLPDILENNIKKITIEKNGDRQTEKRAEKIMTEANIRQSQRVGESRECLKQQSQ